MFTAIYFHMKKGTAFDPLTQLLGHYARSDHTELESGDYVGKVLGTTGQTRRLLEAIPGVTVLPPFHRPITAVHAVLFSHVKAVEGESSYDVAERLYAYHKSPWAHPEEFFL